MSVSSNSIQFDQFLNFVLKNRNGKFDPIGICDKGVGLVGVCGSEVQYWRSLMVCFHFRKYKAEDRYGRLGGEEIFCRI